MTPSLHTLKHEHRVIERALRALDGVCLRLEWGDHVPADALSQLIDLLTTFADGFHHRKEEAYLFPLLEQQGISREGGPLGVMDREHEIERELTAAMSNALEAYKNTYPEGRQGFVEAAHKYRDHLSRHITKEDSFLFRIADEVLDEEDKQSLNEAFKKAEAEIGTDNIEKYERMATELEKTWAV